MTFMPETPQGQGESYRQVMLRRDDTGAFEVAWIPSRFGREGKLVTIDGMDGVWRVDEVYVSMWEGNLRVRRDGRRRFQQVLDHKNQRPKGDSR